MLDDAKYEEKKRVVLECINHYLYTDQTQAQIAQRVGVSQSTVDRYLKDEYLIRQLFPKNGDNIISLIKEKSEKNKKDAHSKGGSAFAQNNIVLKDENGHFIGSKRKEIYDFDFIGKMALEYRLSLDNLCRLLKLEVNDENRQMLREGIFSTVKNNPDEYISYKYLFNYETVLEIKEVAIRSYGRARIFLGKYQKLKEENKLEELNSYNNRLFLTDILFKKLKEEADFSKPLTEEQLEIIARYRIKYNLSRVSTADILGISEKKLRTSEYKIKDDILKIKLQYLAEYLIDITKDKYRRQKNESDVHPHSFL